MSRVYVDNPASVPPRYEPRRGAGGGWYYETESEDDDDILQELIQLISEQILPGMDEESLTEDLLIEEVEQELSERAEQYKGEIRKAVDSIMTEKLSMDRVYVNSEDEVPEGYQPMRDDVGDLYYEVRDAPHIDSGRTSKSRIYVDSPEDVSEKYESQEVEKTRYYVNDPSEVPEQYDVEEGDRGGYYYEVVEGSSSDEVGEEGAVDMADDIGDVGEWEMGIDESRDGVSWDLDDGTSVRVRPDVNDPDKWTVSVSNADILESETMSERVSDEEAFDVAERFLQGHSDGVDLEEMNREELFEPFNDGKEDKNKSLNKEYDVLHDAAGLEKQDDDPCWEGYVQVGMKEGEDGEMVPNCVPEEDVDD